MLSSTPSPPNGSHWVTRTSPHRSSPTQSWSSGPEGTTPVPRAAFLAAVTARSKSVNDSANSKTTLADASAQSLGDRMVLATINWSFSPGDTTTTLLSDFLLRRAGPPPTALRGLSHPHQRP